MFMLGSLSSPQLLIAGMSGRYWRITAVTVSANPAAMTEIELTEDNSAGYTVSQTDGTNHLDGITGTVTGGSMTNSPSVLTDNNLISTSYVYSWDAKEHITWDCTNSVTVGYVRVGFYSSSFQILTAYLSYSDDNTNWKHTEVFSLGSAVANQFTSSNYIAVSPSPSGTQTFTANGTFTVPTGVGNVTVCMIGGGGGGGCADSVTYYSGGGYSGQIISTSYSVTPGENISITIGTGGAGGGNGAGNAGNGSAGTSTSFGSYGTASGGAGGIATNTYSSSLYIGSGQSRSTCAGTFYSGTGDNDGYNMGHGGQAGLANGGNGDCCTTGGAGSAGSGGGGGFYYYGGAGGNGKVIITWGQ